VNQGKRNVVFVGFSKLEIEKLEFEDIREKKKIWNETDLTHRFPRLLYFDTLKEAKRHQGLILFYKMEEEFDFVKYDIENRKQFKNYEYIYLVIPNRNRIHSFYQVMNIAHITTKLSKIAAINFYNLAYHPGITVSLNEIYQQYLKNSKKIFSSIKLNNIEKLKAYTIGKTYIDVKASAKELDVSTKWIERYLIDMNYLYHNVGYDAEKKAWYIVK